MTILSSPAQSSRNRRDRQIVHGFNEEDRSDQLETSHRVRCSCSFSTDWLVRWTGGEREGVALFWESRLRLLQIFRPTLLIPSGCSGVLLFDDSHPWKLLHLPLESRSAGNLISNSVESSQREKPNSSFNPRSQNDLQLAPQRSITPAY